MGGPKTPASMCFYRQTLGPLYLTLMGFDQNQELGHFVKLTHHRTDGFRKCKCRCFCAFSWFQHQREKICVVGFTLAPLPYTHFDQNQELGHFGKLTPPQRGQIPEMPIAACFGAEKFSPENFFQQHFLAENGPHVLVTGLIFLKI